MQHVKMYATSSCPYCIRAKQVLAARGVADLEVIDVDASPQERARMMEITGRRTVPQIFIGTTHIGGCDDLMALDSKGQLAVMLA